MQPEYVSKFQCDGQKCGAWCCRGWRVTIDRETYQKYSELKPRAESKRLMKHIALDRRMKQYMVKHKADGRCPFLTEDNWCSIQRRHGEEYLSQTCASYPRVTRQVTDFYERSLSMTCPVASELILSTTEPMAFEQVELDERAHRANNPSEVNISHGILERAFTIQYAAISILQSRNLTLDERLIVLGFYLDRLDELIDSGQFMEIEDLSAVYSSEEFLTTEAPRLASSVEFDAAAYIRTMFKMLDALYGESSEFGEYNRHYMDAVSMALEVKTDSEKGASVSELAEKYKGLEGVRREFLMRHSIVLEHYLVNEFFLGFYPWKLSDESIAKNYGLFVTTYKILELLGLSTETVWKQFRGDEETPEQWRLTAMIQNVSMSVDHSTAYVKCMVDHLGNDLPELMRSLL